MRCGAGQQVQAHHAALESVLCERAGIPGIGDRVAALLGLPPQLKYLADGFQRISVMLQRERPLLATYAPEVLSQFGDVHLSDLLMSVAQSQAKISNLFGPDALKVMGRPSDRDRHPLSSYCISVCHLWSGLFYTAAPSLEAEPNQFESAFSQFGVFLLGCNARSPVQNYSDFIRAWSVSGRIPEAGHYLDPEIATKLEAGSRAMRRLTLPQFQPLFDWLCPGAHDASDLPKRVTSAFLKGRECWMKEQRDHALKVGLSLENLRGDEVWTALLAIVGVLETSPFWTKPGASRKSSSSSGGTGTRRAVGKDGYVRLVGSDWIVEREVIEDGVVIESHYFMPEDKTGDPSCPPLALEQDQPAIHSVTATRGHPGTSVTTVGHHANRRSHIARQHLRPTCAFQQPTPKEIQQVLGVVRDLGFASGLSTSDIKCRLAVLVMLTTGRSVEAALSLEVIHDRKYIGQSPLQYLSSDSVFSIRTESPQLKTDPFEGLNNSARASAHPTARFVDLPDILGFGDVLSRTNAPADNALWYPIQGLQKKAVTNFLHQVTCEDRLQVSWLSEHVASLLLEACQGDFAPVHMLTGKPLAHSSTQLHYSKYSPEYLRQAHVRCMSMLVNPSSRADVSPLGAIATDSDVVLGNPTHPTSQSVRSLVSVLAGRLTDEDLAFDLVQQNNDFVSYCWLSLILSTGYRPVIAPLVTDVDLAKTGVIVFTDKAYSPSHRRAQFLPRLCSDQLIHLLQHARFLAAQLPQYRETLLQHGPFIHMSNRDGKYCAAPFQPKHFMEATAEIFGLPLYSLRRFVRSELLSAGVSGELVDAFMGHWRHGTEPFSGHTSSRPNALQRLANHEIPRVLVDLGLTAIPSRVHRRRFDGGVT